MAAKFGSAHSSPPSSAAKRWHTGSPRPVPGSPAVPGCGIAQMTPLAAALPDGTAKRKIGNMINALKSTANNLTGRAESHGADDLLDKEQDRDEAAADLVILDQLLAAVQVRHDALPA